MQEIVVQFDIENIIKILAVFGGFIVVMNLIVIALFLITRAFLSGKDE